MKKMLFSMYLCVMCMLLGTGAYAADDSELWEFEEYGGGVCLTEYLGSQTDLYAPAMLTVDGTMYPVLKLGDELFKDNTGLNSVTLGEGIAEIGKSAFEGATNLVCIVTPESLTSIGANAFSGCTSFNSIILYDAVTSIGSDAFAGCDNLTVYGSSESYIEKYCAENNLKFISISADAQIETVVIDDITYYVGNGKATVIRCQTSKSGDVVVPADINGFPVTQIASYAFSGCKYISSVKLPETIINIGDYAFQGCRFLNTINLPDGITVIPDSCFQECYALNDVRIPKSVTYIDDTAFFRCSQLESIEIPPLVTKIEGQTFKYCSSLKEITIPGGVTSIGSSAFEYCNSLSYVYWGGTKKQWNNIDFTYYNECIKDATIICAVRADVTGVALEETNVTMNIGDEIKLIANILPEEADNLNVMWSSSNENVAAVANDGTITAIAPGDAIVTVITEDGGHTAKCNINVQYPYGVDGNVTWSIDNNGILRLSGTGNMNYYDTNSRKAPWYKYREMITGLVIESGITRIGAYAFYDCYLIENAVIPDTVTGIYESAFSGCDSLKRIDIPGSVKTIATWAFKCENLSEVKLGDGIETISDSAFYANALEGIIIPQSVTKIGNRAFGGAAFKNVIVDDANINYVDDNGILFNKSKTQIILYGEGRAATEYVIPDSVTLVGTWAFGNNSLLKAVTIPKSVTTINNTAFSGCTALEEVNFEENENTEIYVMGIGAFRYCSALKSITIPEGVTAIYDYTFEGCSALTDIRFPKTLTTISSKAFNFCTSLVSLDLPEGLTYLSGFRGCTALTSVKIPESVITIGTRAFSGCTGITSIIIPENVEAIEMDAFNGASLSEITFKSSKITKIGKEAFNGNDFYEIVLPDSITSIGEGAFKYNFLLEKVSLPANIDRIEPTTFYFCEKLKEVEIPDNVTEIGKSAFGNCTALENIRIHSGVKTICEYAFNGCKLLRNVIIEEGLENLENNIFYGCVNMKTVVLPESVKNAEANAFSSVPVILCVYKDSYMHIFADTNNLPYFIMRKIVSPDISYGVGISGIALYNDGTPAANATVEIIYDDGTVKESVVADESGAYSFTYAEVGRYTIRATDASGNTASDVVSVKRMNVFDVFVAGETELVLKKGYTVSGTVVPAGSVTVTLTDTDGNVIAALDTDGNYSFENVPNGTYVITAANESGSVSKEITVFNGNVTVEEMTISELSAVIKGDVEIEDRDKSRCKRVWIQVTLYNSGGVAVAQVKTDENGAYCFSNVPLGKYAIVAETSEMRPDKKHGFDRAHTLTGYAYIDAVETGEYIVDTIVLYEENDHLAEISGKVTAQGESNASEVVLSNVFRYEIARCVTGRNGKYTFKKVQDGLYFVTAVTESDGMGFAVVTVREGKVYGNTDIAVRKEQHIINHELSMEKIPECYSREDALKYRKQIADEKRFYDGLSEKEKKQLSKKYIERLNRMSELLTGCAYTTDEGVLENSGMIISGDEIEDDTQIEFVLNIEKTTGGEISSDGIKSDEDFIQKSIEDAAGKREIVQYYDISLTKKSAEGEETITRVSRDTDTTGKLRITLDIPEEYRGHRHYSFVHMHNGEAVTLVDLDDNPNTVTFEIDRFSTFVLTVTDEELTAESEEASASITAAGDGKISVSANAASTLYIASYDENGCFTGVVSHNLSENTQNEEFDFAEGCRAFIWDSGCMPLCSPYPTTE